MRAGHWGSAIPADSQAAYPLPSRVRDVPTPSKHLQSCLGVGGREENVLDVSSSLPPEFLEPMHPKP